MKEYQLEKSIRTEKDFEQMGWHDCNIYGLIFHNDNTDNFTTNLIFDIDYIFNQKHLVLDYASDIQNDVWQKARESNAYSIAILWKIMIRMIYRLSLQSSNLLVVRHEDLCDRTIAEGKKICRHFDMSWSDGVLDYVRKSSTSSNIETALGDTKNMDRNSKAITSVWRGKVSEEVNGILRDVIAEDWALYYD